MSEKIPATLPPADGAHDTAAPGAYLSIPSDVILEHVSDETVMLDLRSGTYFGLDAIGTRMLDLCLELPDAAAVVDTLQSEFDAEPDVLARDLEALILELVEAALVLRS